MLWIHEQNVQYFRRRSEEENRLMCNLKSNEEYQWMIGWLIFAFYYDCEQFSNVDAYAIL